MKDLILKYRPQTFEACWSQRGAVYQIQAFLHSETLPIGLILSGTYGTGKTTLAHLVSGSLACLKPQNLNPCHTCEGCEYADKWFMFHRGRMILHCGQNPTKRFFEFCRELQHQSFFPIVRRRYSVVLDEAHKLKEGIQDRILPLMENTPNMTFIFCTTRVDQLSEAIQARSQIIHMGTPEPNEVQRALRTIAQAEGIDLSEAEALSIATEMKCVPRECLKRLEWHHAMKRMPPEEEPMKAKPGMRLR